MTLRVGIAGLGRWGQVLINSIHEKSETLAVVAGCTGRKEKAAAYCSSKGIDLRKEPTGGNNMLRVCRVDASGLRPYRQWVS